MPPTIDDLFPPSPRTLFEKAPIVLLQVVCSVQFPRVLRIEAQPPAEFQEAIRGVFPLYERPPGLVAPQGMEIPREVLQLLSTQVGSTAHQFLTEDRKSTVALTPENVSLTTTGYTRWEDFRAQVHEILTALARIYAPPFYSRVGLRYIDVLHRESLGLKGRPWSALINPDLIGVFPFARFEEYVPLVSHKVAVRLPDGTGTATVQHGLVFIQHSPPRPERSYLIDFEFSAQPKTEIAHAESRLDHFNELAGRAFRWSLTGELRDALGPRELPPRGNDERRPVVAGRGG
jgi:uncharacterized protein (TIGR04255 family)